MCFLLLSAAPSLADTPLSIAESGSQVVIKVGDQPLLVYQYAQHPFKPYVQKFFTPQGVNVVRDAPADHLHHHGLMFAIAADGVNFWEEKTRPGMQRHRELSVRPITDLAGISWATFTQDLDWVLPGSEAPILHERRTLAATNLAAPKASVLAWMTRLEAPPDRPQVKLTGSKYFGLGMRFLTSMDTGGQFRNASGQTGVEGTNDKQSNWCAYGANADGKPVTVVMFDAPSNPRHPATWFTMDKGFAYLSATLNLANHPLVIEPGSPLVLRYAVALWDGQPTSEEIERLYQQLVQWSSQVEQP
jgi:hypothetical protein